MPTETGKKRAKPVQVKKPIDIDSSIPFRIVRLANLFGTNFDRFASSRKNKISLTEWRVMMTLAFHPGISAIGACRYTGYSEVNVSRALSRMQERGWVNRTRDPHDRRKTQWELTPAGAMIYNQLQPLAEASIADLTAQISPSQEKQLHRYFDKFIEIMEDIISS